MPDWNYLDESGNGPSNWPTRYGAGKFQSPINILIDFCDLRMKKHTNSASQLETRLGQTLTLNNQHHRHAHHRDHLNSVGNDDDVDGDEDDDYEDNERRSPSSSSSESSSNWGKQRRQSNQRLKQQAQQTRYCVTNKKIFLGYPRYLNSVNLSNTGHAWQVSLAPELASHTLLCGPPLGDREYRLVQFHCHWGKDCATGSEHQINGQSYSAELHFVHWNCTQFKSAEEAAKHKHGLAVLGVFVQALEGEQARNKHLDRLISGLVQINQPGKSVELTNTRLDLKKLFPTNRWDYATYEGSLTTPPLSEVVDWLVFLQPIQCSQSQLEAFRQMRCPEGALLDNCRPVQALNQRTVTIWTHA